MVDVKLDTSDWEKVSADHLISVRVGEAQKLAKISASRSYKFPASAVGTRKYAKVEVFQRVGSGIVCIDPGMASGVNELEVTIAGGVLKFAAEVTPCGPEAPAAAATKAEDGKPNEKTKAKKEAAEYYLQQHHLEARLADAMHAVLRARPADPAAFLAERLAHNAELVAKLPKPHAPEERGPPPPPEDGPPPAGEEGAQKCAPPASALFPTEPLKPQRAPLLPFAPYYATYFASPVAPGSLYAKFPKSPGLLAALARAEQPRGRFAPYYAANFKAPVVPSSLYAKFPKPAAVVKAQAAKPAAKGVAGPKRLLPSLGSYHGPTNFGGVIVHHPAKAAAPPVNKMTLPSVGTWLVRPPRPQVAQAKAAAKAPFKVPESTLLPSKPHMVSTSLRYGGSNFWGLGLRPSVTIL